jgi:hypothetical protein
MSQDLSAQLEQLRNSLGVSSGVTGVHAPTTSPYSPLQNNLQGVMGQGVMGQGVMGQGVMGQGVMGQGVMGQGVMGQGCSSVSLIMKKYGKYLIVLLLVAVGCAVFIIRKKLALKNKPTLPTLGQNVGPGHGVPSIPRYQGPPPPGFAGMPPPPSRVVGSDDPNFTPLQ